MHLFVIHSYIHLLLYSAEQQQRLFFIWKVVWKTDMNFSLYLFKYIVTERIWVCVLTFTYVFHNKGRECERETGRVGEKVNDCVSGVSLFNINANNYCCQFASQKAEYPESLPNNLPPACALFSPPLTDCLLSVSVESFSGNFIRKNNATAPIQCIVVSAMMMMMMMGREKESKRKREQHCSEWWYSRWDIYLFAFAVIVIVAIK